MTGLNATLTMRPAKSCALRKSSSAGYRPAVSTSKLPPIVTGTSGATRRMFSMIRSKVPWPPRSGRMRSCVSRSPSSVTFTPVSPSGTMHSTISGVSSRPLVMMLTDCLTPRDAACFEDRPAISNMRRHVQQRLAAEEREHQPARLHLVDLLRDPGGHLRGGVDRHPLGRPPGFSVLALVAVVAGEVALQCREDRDAQLRRVLAELGEVRLEGGALGRAVADEESVLCQRRQRLLALPSRAAGSSAEPESSLSSSATTSSDTTACASVSVFIRNTSPLASGTRTLKAEGLIEFVAPVSE